MYSTLNPWIALGRVWGWALKMPSGEVVRPITSEDLELLPGPCKGPLRLWSGVDSAARALNLHPSSALLHCHCGNNISDVGRDRNKGNKSELKSNPCFSETGGLCRLLGRFPGQNSGRLGGRLTETWEGRSDGGEGTDREKAR